MINSMESSAQCSSSPPEVTITGDHNDTLPLLQAWISSFNYDAANSYLKSNELHQNTLDRCLQCVFEKEQEKYNLKKFYLIASIKFSSIKAFEQYKSINESGRLDSCFSLLSPETIKLLLQLGAKWNHDVELKDLITPYHIICRSIEDDSELLDLMIESTGRRFLNTKDSTECTPLMYAVRQGNINCVKSLITHGADLNVGNEKFKDESFIEHYKCKFL